MYFYVIIGLTLAIDLATKIAIRANLELGEKTEILGGLLRLTNIVNTGATGNIFHGMGRLLAVLALVIVGVALYLRSRGKLRGKPMQIAVALIVGGAAGNAIDRILYNQVTDFLHFHDAATMNFADIWVFAGILTIFAIQVIRLFKPEETAAKEAETTR